MDTTARDTCLRRSLARACFSVLTALQSFTLRHGDSGTLSNFTGLSQMHVQSGGLTRIVDATAVVCL